MNFRLLAALALVVVASPAAAQETRTVTDDLGVSVEIPVHPQRIVALHDVSLTVPLIELGVTPVGSHGRTTAEGAPFIRSSSTLTGIDFANSAIEFVGNYPADIEAVAALQPDLILTTTWQPLDPSLLRAVAPTIVVDESLHPETEIYAFLADLTGTQERYAALRARYESQIAQIKRIVDTSSITVSILQGVNGQAYVLHTYGALGSVLRDAGFKFPEAVDAIPEGGDAFFSAEQLPLLDADFVFDTYRTDALQIPADAIANMNQVLPGYCEFLHACRNGQYIVLPREEASANSFYGRGLMAITVLGQIGGRAFVPKPD